MAKGWGQMLICTSYTCLPKTLQRKNKPTMGGQISIRPPTTKSSTLPPWNPPAIKLESMILNNIRCFLRLSFQEKLASNTLVWKLVLETSGGSSIRSVGWDQALCLWLRLKLRTGTHFPGGLDCLVNLMRSSSLGLHPEPHTHSEGPSKEEKRIKLWSSQPSASMGPFLVGPKAGSGILASFA